MTAGAAAGAADCLDDDHASVAVLLPGSSDGLNPPDSRPGRIRSR